MDDGSLQEDLLSIPGVEGAEVEGSADKPAGLRIRIAEGADQRAVGGAIRRVLTAHGLGTDTRLPGEAAADEIAPVAAVPDGPADEVRAEDTEVRRDDAAAAVAVVADEERSVIDLTDRTGAAVPEEPETTAESSPPTADDATTEAGEESEVGIQRADTEPAVDEVVVSAEAEHRRDDAGEEDATVESPEGPRSAAVGEPPGGEPGVARLARVGVEEGRDGIMVTVASSDGTEVKQAAASTEGGVEAAVVKATAKLAMPDAPDANVVDISDRRIEGVDIVMIVLDVDGTIHAGSAVVGAGRSFALGRATWAALTL